MTTKEKVIQVIEALPENATLDDIVAKLQHLDPQSMGESSLAAEPALPREGAWDLLEQAAGTVDMPVDWASEHDHYLYGTSKRSPPT